MPNLIPKSIVGYNIDWARPAGRLIWACFLLLVGLVIVAVLMRRPKPDRPATWSECMAGAVGVFAMMTLAYAVIPHEWITFSDKYLQFDTTKFVFRSHQDVFGLGIVNWPFNMVKQDVRDILVVLIYLVLFGLNLYLFSAWQKRGAKATEPDKPRTSRFGRPLRRKQAEPAAAAAGASAGPA